MSFLAASNITAKKSLKPILSPTVPAVATKDLRVTDHGIASAPTASQAMCLISSSHSSASLWAWAVQRQTRPAATLRLG